MKIELSEAEALVLFEWLARSDEEEKLSFDHPAEQKVLWRLEGQLENQVPVTAPNYGELVDEARRTIDEAL